MNINFSGGLIVTKYPKLSTLPAEESSKVFDEVTSYLGDRLTNVEEVLKMTDGYTHPVTVSTDSETFVMKATGQEAEEYAAIVEGIQGIVNGQTRRHGLGYYSPTKALEMLDSIQKKLGKEILKQALAGKIDLPDEVLKQMPEEVQAYFPEELQNRLSIEA